MSVDSIAEIIERYKKEQIVEGHILGAPVLRVSAHIGKFGRSFEKTFHKSFVKTSSEFKV